MSDLMTPIRTEDRDKVQIQEEFQLFDHDAHGLRDAIGIDGKEIHGKLLSTIMKLAMSSDERGVRRSVACEAMEKEFSKRELAFLTAHLASSMLGSK